METEMIMMTGTCSLISIALSVLVTVGALP